MSVKFSESIVSVSRQLSTLGDDDVTSFLSAIDCASNATALLSSSSTSSAALTHLLQTLQTVVGERAEFLPSEAANFLCCSFLLSRINATFKNRQLGEQNKKKGDEVCQKLAEWLGYKQ